MPAAIALITLSFLAAAPSGGRPPAGSQPPEPAARAVAAVTENLKTEAGRKYADSAGVAAAGPLAAAAQTCQDSLSGGQAGKGKAQPPSDSSALDVYLMLNRRGGVKALIAHPPGGIGDCLARRPPAALALPAPPGGNYWIKVRVPGAPKG